MASRITVARMLERQDFFLRYQAQRPIAVSEFLYPILQAQVAAGQQPESIMVMPLLGGADGTAKMSKTAGNAIGITEAPAEMFGKVMSIPDQLMPCYYLLAAGLTPEESAAEIRSLQQGAVHPAAAKRRLARRIVARYRSPQDARQAEQRFDIQFRERGIPGGIPEIKLPDGDEHGSWRIPDLLIMLGLTQAKSEARRSWQAMGSGWMADC